MKQLRCSHFYPDCNAVMRGETDDEVMAEAARHGREAHGENPDQWTASEIEDMRFRIEDV